MHGGYIGDAECPRSSTHVSTLPTVYSVLRMACSLSALQPASRPLPWQAVAIVSGLSPGAEPAQRVPRSAHMPWNNTYQDHMGERKRLAGVTQCGRASRHATGKEPGTGGERMGRAKSKNNKKESSGRRRTTNPVGADSASRRDSASTGSTRTWRALAACHIHLLHAFAAGQRRFPPASMPDA